MNTFYAANIILKHFIDKAEPIRNMKLQKLLYFSCGWYSAFHEDWLIEDEFYAWPYGPVCPKLYNKVSKWSNYRITNLISHYKNFDGDVSDAKRNIINQVLEQYGDYNDWTLSDITHKPDAPWSMTLADDGGIGDIISRTSIRKHYKKLEKGKHGT